MKIIHHRDKAARAVPLHWGQCQCFGMEPQRQGQCQGCSNPQQACSRLPAGRHRGAGAPHLAGPGSPERAAGTARPFPCGWAASPRCCGDGTGRQQAGGGRARIVSLPGAHQGHRVHLIRRCSILGPRGAARRYQMTSSARQRAGTHSAAHCS